jgi:hypothetical protein
MTRIRSSRKGEDGIAGQLSSPTRPCCCSRPSFWPREGRAVRTAERPSMSVIACRGRLQRLPMGHRRSAQSATAFGGNLIRRRTRQLRVPEGGHLVEHRGLQLCAVRGSKADTSSGGTNAKSGTGCAGKLPGYHRAFRDSGDLSSTQSCRASQHPQTRLDFEERVA